MKYLFNVLIFSIVSVFSGVVTLLTKASNSEALETATRDSEISLSFMPNSLNFAFIKVLLSTKETFQILPLLYLRVNEKSSIAY